MKTITSTLPLAVLVVFGLGGLGLVGCNSNEAPAGEVGTTDTSAGGDIRTPGTVGGTGTSVGTGTAAGGTGTAAGDGAGSSEAADGVGGTLSPAPIRPLTAPVSMVNGWSYCAKAYQALHDAAFYDEDADIQTWQINVLSSYGQLTPRRLFNCFAVNATPALQRAAFRGLAGFGGNDLQRCWSSDRNAPGWPPECVHPQKIADEIARVEAQLESAHLTDAMAVDPADPVDVNNLVPDPSFDDILGGLSRPSWIFHEYVPYFFVANRSRFDLPEAASIRLFRTRAASFESTYWLNEEYYKEGAWKSQPVICVNRDIASIAADCR